MSNARYSIRPKKIFPSHQFYWEPRADLYSLVDLKPTSPAPARSKYKGQECGISGKTIQSYPEATVSIPYTETVANTFRAMLPATIQASSILAVLSAFPL